MKEEQKIVNHLLDHLQNENGFNTKDPIVKTWLETDAENKQKLSEYIKIWDGINALANKRIYDTPKAWEKIDAKISKQSVRANRFKNFFLSGVAAAVFVLLGFYFYSNWIASNSNLMQFTTPLGSRSEVLLPDGTKVLLNGGSELTYHYNQRKKIRNVRFVGEGFFEVEKDKAPFIVEMQEGLKLKVLGTKFSISAYAEDNVIKTTLTEGKVELNGANKAQLIITPGQIASYNKSTNGLLCSIEKPAHNLGWMENKLYMDNMSLKEICRVLERWYDVQITISGDKLGESVHYTGVIREKSIYDVMEALSQISDVSYKMDGKKIIVSESG